eukprot:m.304134 g.304134  ORF g.304134 m.304134 type:complete len:271 (-) comp55262_c2_seq6:310-1122(-)
MARLRLWQDHIGLGSARKVHRAGDCCAKRKWQSKGRAHLQRFNEVLDARHASHAGVLPDGHSIIWVLHDLQLLHISVVQQVEDEYLHVLYIRRTMDEEWTVLRVIPFHYTGSTRSHRSDEGVTQQRHCQKEKQRSPLFRRAFASWSLIAPWYQAGMLSMLSMLHEGLLRLMTTSSMDWMAGSTADSRFLRTTRTSTRTTKIRAAMPMPAPTKTPMELEESLAACASAPKTPVVVVVVVTADGDEVGLAAKVVTGAVVDDTAAVGAGEAVV